MIGRHPPRLSARALTRASAATVPDYDRSPTPRFVHLGVGAFARAHLGVYADDLLRRGWPATIRGVSLRSRRAEDQLGPQDGLYTVGEREPGAGVPLRVVGAVTSVGTGPAAAVEAIGDPATRMVTLTVTEKGYEVDPHDLAFPHHPRSAPGIVALALAQCSAAGAPPPVVASLDNLLDSGAVLRDRVLEVAERLDPALPDWIAREVRFPSSVVDRMVPAATERDIEDVGRRLGLVDLAAVVAERHRSWVIAAVDGLPPLADVGVQVVDDVAPFQRRKLWLLNGPHSALAYCGLLAGCPTIAAAADHDRVSSFVRQLTDDILAVADLPAGTEPSAFALDALRRFRNPALGHACAQVGADGSRKLPQRLLPVVAARRRRALGTTRFAVVVAAWIAAVAGIPVRGAPLPSVEDPAGEALRAAATGGDLRRVAGAALDGHCDAAFVAEVAAALDRLVRDGAEVLAE